MRFSLGFVGDLEVTPGATLRECRPALDALLGPSAGADLSVAGHALAPEQVAGVPPWLPGSHVDVGPAGPAGPNSVDPAVVAASVAAARWHVAVVAGPDAGAVAAPGPDGRLVVGRGSDGAGRLALTDPAVSRAHAVLLARGRRVVVRDAGSANRTWRRSGPSTRAPRRPTRRAPWRRVWWVARVSPGDRLRLGATELELRRDVTAPPADAREASAPAPPERRAEPGATVGRVAAAVVPLALAATMAAVTRSPVFLVMAAAGPLVAAAPVIAARVARTRTPAVAPDLGPDAAALTVLAARGHTSPPAWWPLAREGLAVVGDDDARAAAGRALVGGAVHDPSVALTLLHKAGRAPAWRWARWLEPRLGGVDRAGVPSAGGSVLGPTGDRALVVADGAGPWRTDLERWWLTGAAGQQGPAAPGPPAPDRAAVVLVGPGEAPPAWCRWVVVLRGDGQADLSGPGVARVVPAPAASTRWAEAHARRVAARDALRRFPARDLPSRVGPADVGLPGDVVEVVAAWGGPAAGHRALPGLRVPIGLATGTRGAEPAWLDLSADGPHALVAGTTGAGKSELLQALVLGLALRHPPAELALVLLDFKGGAGLRACTGLPHVVGHVSDLDPDGALRALEALTAELRRREALLAAAGVSDVESLRGPAAEAARLPCADGPAAPPGAPPRLLVVVDEFRALAEDLPDFVPALVRLAAQGRSLGMHLVLATQRPAGAVTAQMRANLALRICLRVTDPAESHDVVDVPDAAALPARAPGRAVVRRADGAPQVVQTTWMALPVRRPAPVRPARPWESFGRREDTEPLEPPRAEALAALTAAAAAGLGVAPGDPLWSPPLPSRVGPRELDEVVRDRGPMPGGGLVLGLTDPPGAGRRGLLTWDGRGLLLVAGSARSGRTTAAARAGTAALLDGRHVHAVGPAAGLLPRRHPGLGTTVDATDPRRLTRLLTVLASGSTPRPDAADRTLLVVDDVAALAAALERMPRGAGTDLLERLARESSRTGIGLLVTGHPRDVARLAPLATARLVLPVADPADDALLGVPRELSGRRAPGRGVLVAGGTAVRCHVATPTPVGDRPEPGVTGGAPRDPLRLRPIPPLAAREPTSRVRAASHRARLVPSWEATLGPGGDAAAPLTVDARRGVLVVGPPGSGRSTTLATLALALAEAGLRVGVLAHDGPLASAARATGMPRADTPRAAACLTTPGGQGGAAWASLDALVVDDLDALARAEGELDDRLAGWVHAADRGEPAPAVLAACRTDRAASAYRGVVAALRGAAPMVVLDPGEPGSAEAAGADLSAVCDPALPRHPGRGALVVRGRATPLQVACPGRDP